eukprot:JP441921.1.p2 GENE.JP441921.1~~JP441921.1.p2  ORF type:complete len:65 (+),score=3.11 JP441921.1:35-229(+)
MVIGKAMSPTLNVLVFCFAGLACLLFLLPIVKHRSIVRNSANFSDCSILLLESALSWLSCPPLN